MPSLRHLDFPRLFFLFFFHMAIWISVRLTSLVIAKELFWLTFFLAASALITYKSTIPSRQSSQRHTSSPNTSDPNDPILLVESSESVRRRRTPPGPVTDWAAASIFRANSCSMRLRGLDEEGNKAMSMARISWLRVFLWENLYLMEIFLSLPCWGVSCIFCFFQHSRLLLKSFVFFFVH